MKQIFLLVFSLLCFTITEAQSIKRLANDTVIWQEGVPLTRDDFKGKVRNKMMSGATQSGMVLYRKEENGDLVFYVEAVMVKSKSFLNGESEYVLNHEQRHFDLTEAYARQLRKKLSEANFMKMRDMGSALSKMYQDINEDLQKEQDKFDKDTEHGNNSVKQKYWNERIDAMLKEFEQYAGTAVAVSGK